MAPVQRDDPYAGFNFLVELSGVGDEPSSPMAGFSEVSGLGAETQVIEYRNGNEAETTVRKLPGLTKYSNIVLKRGIVGDLTFWNWVRQTVEGQVLRVDGTISMLDEKREIVMRFTFRRGWPCKWEGPSLNAKGSEVAMETLEICHEGLTID